MGIRDPRDYDIRLIASHRLEFLHPHLYPGDYDIRPVDIRMESDCQTQWRQMWVSHRASCRYKRRVIYRVNMGVTSREPVLKYNNSGIPVHLTRPG